MQTELITGPTSNQSKNMEEEKLSMWLKKIIPSIERELRSAQIQDESKSMLPKSNSFLSINYAEEVYLGNRFTKHQELTAKVCWLSVKLQNCPILAVSCSAKSLSVTEQTDEFLTIYEPQRDSGNCVHWQETISLPLRNPIDYLVANLVESNIFAGASSAGDLYIWIHEKTHTSNESKVEEIFSCTCEESIIGISFMGHFLMVCLINGSIDMYRLDSSNRNCAIERKLKIDKTKTQDSRITSMISVEGASSPDFIIGLLNGKVLIICKSHLYHKNSDLMTYELKQHNFSVKYLKHHQKLKKNFVVSGDVSNEIFIHELDVEREKSIIKMVLKLPFPLKSSLSINENMEHVLSFIPNGNLEIYNIYTNTRRILEENDTATGTICELSRNE